MPPDIGFIIYVACTRVKELKNLFVGPIFPTTWDLIGKSETDKQRRESEHRLLRDAQEFSIRIEAYREFRSEQDFKPDYINNEREWQEIVSADQPPTYVNPEPMATGIEGDYWHTAVESETHIGIDQGIKNFAMTVGK